MNVFLGQNSFNEFVSRSENGTKALCAALERVLSFYYRMEWKHHGFAKNKNPNFPTFKICSVCTWWLNPALRLLPLLPPPFEAPGRSGAEDAPPPPPEDRLNELRGYLRGIVQFGLSFSQTRSELLLLFCCPHKISCESKVGKGPLFSFGPVPAEERLSTMKTTPPMVVLVAFLHWGAHERGLRGKFPFRAQLFPIHTGWFFSYYFLCYIYCSRKQRVSFFCHHP